MANVDNFNNATLAYRKIYQLHSSADHIIAACCLKDEYCYQDYGEFGAGNKLLKQLLETVTLANVVFVVRRYGGHHLGADRFEIVKKAAKQDFT